MDVIKELDSIKQKSIDFINNLPVIPCFEFGKTSRKELSTMVNEVLKIDEDTLGALMYLHIGDAKRNFDKHKVRNYSEEEILLEAVRLIVNEFILSFNEETRKSKDEMKRNNRSINKIFEILKKDPKSIDKDKIVELVKSLKLGEDYEVEIIDELLKYIKELEETQKRKKELEEKERLLKEKEEEEERIDKENERIKREEAEALMTKKNIEDRVSNFELIKDTFDKYDYLYPDDIFYSNLELVFPLEDIKEALSYECMDIDETLYSTFIISLLTLLDSDKGPALAREIKDCIGLLSNKYELNVELTNLEASFVNAYKNNYLTDKEFDELADIQTTIIELKKKIFYDDETAAIISRIKTTLRQYDKIKLEQELSSSEGIKLQSFILFDYELDEYGQKRPYIIQDLDESSNKTLIDVSLDRQKLLSNGYYDFNDLIDDLLLHGEPRILSGGNFSRKDKIINPVFYTESQYGRVDNKMQNSTGMLRIKPNLTSYTRFVDEKVEFLHRTTKFKQITELIKSLIPGIVIDEEKDFGIFINIMDAFKMKDKSGYLTAIHRQAQSKLRDVLKTKNSSFTDEELEYIANMIKLSMKTFSDLEKINDAFDFSVINKIKNKTLS